MGAPNDISHGDDGFSIDDEDDDQEIPLPQNLEGDISQAGVGLP